MSAKWIQRATFLLAVVFILYLDYQILRSFFTPLAWAAVLAIFFYPVHARLHKYIKKPNVAAVASLVVVLALLVGPAVTVGAACIQQGIALSKNISGVDLLPTVREYLDWVRQHVPIQIPELQGPLLDVARSAGSLLARHSAEAAGNAAQLFLEVGVMVLTLFFLFRDGDKVVGFLRDTAPTDVETSNRMFGEVTTMVNVTLQSTVIVALAQGAIAGLVFWILGMPAPVFFGVAASVLAFLPVIGPALVWAPAGIILLVSGEYWRGIAMLLLGAFGVSGIDNLLRPMLIADRGHLNALLSLLSVLGGIYAFGFLGMVLGPLVVAITMGMLKGYRDALQAEALPPVEADG